MWRWRFVLLVAVGIMAAAVGTVLAIAINVATGGTARPFPFIERHPWQWSAGGTLGVAIAGLCVWWAQQSYERGLAELVPAEQRPEPWVVDRPREVGQIVRALRPRGAATVGITIAVHGAGGFGKTTVAKMIRTDQRILRRFRGRIYWVTVGRDVRNEALARLVNGLIAQIKPDQPVTFTDARQAGDHLAALLAAGPTRLLILDDVWTEDQAAAFPVAGRCTRLITTRNPSLLPAGSSASAEVDQMSVKQARTVLLADLPQALPPAVVSGLASQTGLWPLLLRLINKILTDQARLTADIAPTANALLDQLRRDGALQVDHLTGAAAQHLDVSDPRQRRHAVRATIEASIGLLSPADRDRFSELAVFAEDEIIPLTLVTKLWQDTGGLDPIAARALCARLADLALLTLTRTNDGGAIALHDVIRAYLRHELGASRLAQLHKALLHASARLPVALAPTASGGRSGEVTAWWQLPESDRYLRDHLIEHLLAAGQGADAETVATDLRWVAARLKQSGPAAPYADIARLPTHRAGRLARLLAQTAHLLAPTDPPHSLIDILYGRVEHDPEWGPQVQALRRDRTLPALVSKWRLPDLPDPALRRTFTVPTGHVSEVAISPDGTWLATASGGSVCIWDPVTGLRRATITAPTEKVSAMAIAPDGSWLAIGGTDGSGQIWDVVTGQLRTLTGAASSVRVAGPPGGSWLAAPAGESVRIWDLATGQQRATIVGHTHWVNAVAISPDGAWLAVGGGDGSVQIWDVATGQQRTFTSGRATVSAVAISPDGAWLATAAGGSLQIWDVASGQQRLTLAGHTGWVSAMAISPDGSWIATASGSSVQIWDAAAGQQPGSPSSQKRLRVAVAISPDGSWIATDGSDGSVQIWDAATGRRRATLTGTYGVRMIIPMLSFDATPGSGSGRTSDGATGRQHGTSYSPSSRMWPVAISPDGTWLATGGGNGSVQIWDVASGQQRATLAGHAGWVTAVAISQDGSWIATGESDGSVQIWDVASGQQRATLAGDAGLVYSVLISPDGSWIVTGDIDGSVQIWDAATGQQRATLPGSDEVWAISPDGSWIATAGNSVQIWDAATGQQRVTVTSGTGAVTAISISPDGSWIATGAGDGSVQIWDTTTGRQRASLAIQAFPLSVAISPDGSWIATGAGDGSVQIWDAATGKVKALMRLEYVEHSCSCVWSPSGQSLVVRGDGGLYHFTFIA